MANEIGGNLDGVLFWNLHEKVFNWRKEKKKKSWTNTRKTEKWLEHKVTNMLSIHAGIILKEWKSIWNGFQSTGWEKNWVEINFSKKFNSKLKKEIGQ